MEVHVSQDCHNYFELWNKKRETNFDAVQICSPNPVGQLSIDSGMKQTG